MTRKEEIRQMITRMKARMSDEEIARLSEGIAEQFFISREYLEADIVFIYMSANQEVRTQPVIDRAISDGKRVAAPVTFPGRRMEFVYLDEDTQFVEKQGIREPAGGEMACLGDMSYEKICSGTAFKLIETDRNVRILIIVPGLAFGRDGSRIGYGGGYYDRYFERMEMAGFVNVYKAAFCFDFQYLESLPTERHDRKMDSICIG